MTVVQIVKFAMLCKPCFDWYGHEGVIGPCALWRSHHQRCRLAHHSRDPLEQEPRECYLHNIAAFSHARIFGIHMVLAL